MAEAVELLDREETAIGQNGIERQAAMAFAQDEPVAIAPARLSRIMTQKVIIEDANDLNQRQCRANMAPAAILDGPKNQAPEMSAALIQGFKLDGLEIGTIIQHSPNYHVDTILRRLRV